MTPSEKSAANKAWYEANKDNTEFKAARRERQKAWVAANPEKVKAARERNKERNNKASKAWYEEQKNDPGFKEARADYQRAYMATGEGQQTLAVWKAANKDSLATYAKKYQQSPAGREAIKRAQLKRQTSNRAVIDAAKNKPCADCGETHPPYAMDFDHLPGSGKMYNVSDMLGGWSAKRVQEEIAKCEVVCATCHRKRTQSRLTK